MKQLHLSKELLRREGDLKSGLSRDRTLDTALHGDTVKRKVEVGTEEGQMRVANVAFDLPSIDPRAVHL